jgi:folate-binding protein YgfZ
VAGRAWLAVSPPGAVAVVDVRGRDAREFLHRMLTQDVRGLEPGAARRACFLTREGRVVADLVVWRTSEGLRLVLDAAAAAGAVPALERYVIADDVALADVSREWAHALLFGAGAPEAVAGAGVGVPAPGRIVGAVLGGTEALVLRRDLGSVPAFEVLVPAGGAGTAFAALAAVPGVVPAGEAEVDAARVAGGAARWGAEVDDRVLPTEAGLEEAVSWTKGCYLGQEPVVMARHRGHPASLLVRLSVSGDAVPARGTALLDGERRLGRVTTAARLPEGVAALALVRHADARVGASFSLEASPARATVTSLLAR